MKIYLSFLLIILRSLSCFSQVDTDFKGSSDHTLISRYPGSTIMSYFSRDYDEVKFPISYSKNEVINWKVTAGKHTSIHYTGPKDRSPLEIMRNFKNALENEGAEILFACSGRECDNGKASYDMKFFNKVFATEGMRSSSEGNHYGGFAGSDQQQYLFCKLGQNNKVIYVSIAVIDSYWAGVEYLVEIVESKEMDSGLVSVNAESLRNKIEKDGKMALYGIYFDTGKSTIKPESTVELNAVIDYLRANSEVNLYIVGHTDDTGDYLRNQLLSEQRAQAIVNHLKENKISADRLKAIGVGPACPVASNLNEEGRSKNRRVEIVRKL